MADNIVQSMFGLSPWQVQQQRMQYQDKSASDFAQLDPMQRANYGIYKGAGMLAGAGAEAMGMVDPAMQEAQQRQQQLSGLDTSSPESILQYASQVQDPKMRIQLQMLAQQRQDEIDSSELKQAQAKKAIKDAMPDTPWAKIDPKDYTPESLKIFSETGKPADLIVNPESLKNKGSAYFSFLPTSSGYAVGDNRTGVITRPELVKGVDGKPLVRATDSPALQGEISGAKSTGEGMGKVSVEQYNAADAAVNSIPEIDNLLTHLNESEAITGLGAEVFKNIERAITLFGGKDSAKKVKDTELLDVMMGKEVFPMIHELGIGARGMDTPAEREFMRQVLTGSITLNKATLIRMAETRRRIAKRAIDKWNTRTDKGELDRFYESTGLAKKRFEVTEPKAKEPTEAEINYTAMKYKMTPAQVRAKLKLSPK